MLNIIKIYCIIQFLFAFSFVNAQNKLPGWALGPFVRPADTPILTPDNSLLYSPFLKDSVQWESNAAFNPAATIKDRKIYILYRAETKKGKGIGGHTSRIGLAVSYDGININKRYKKPVLYPEFDDQKMNEWPGGCEDPRVAVTKDGTYVMFYTQWNKKVPRLAVATSTDLFHWTKYGPVFRSVYNGKFLNMPTKSASIVTKVINGKKVITKINDKYFMYWGEHHIYAAVSANLIDWKPLINKDSSLKILASPRKGYFDSDLTECGPPAIVTKDGILLIYNGKNSKGTSRSYRYAPGAYSGGQILFDRHAPTKILQRLDSPFFTPVKEFEKTGQYPDGTVFTEGLVYFQKKWFLYYGCADSRVAVAVYDPKSYSRL